MRALIRQIFLFFAHLGGFGLLGLGILDSSFLFMPLGNDLLIVALTVRKPELMPFYAVMAAGGSVIGCAITYFISRKGGEEGLEKRVPRKRLNYVKKKVAKRAGMVLGLAALMPPPFPFTIFVAVLAVLDYPRKRLLAIVGGARLLRFAGLGLLAMYFGRRILRVAESPMFYYAVLAVIVVSVIGSTLSVLHWVRRSKKIVRAEPKAA